MSSPFSSRAVRLAIHDSMLQEDQRAHARLADRLRAENAQYITTSPAKPSIKIESK